MTGARFLNILKKQKYTLIVLPVVVMAVAFLLVRKMPNVYTSRSTIAAGLVDASQQVMLDKNFLQDNKVNQAFGNLMQIMQMKKMYDQVSYQLILHDLTNSNTFRKPSKLLGYLNDDAKRHAVATFTELYANRQPLSLWNEDQKGLNEVLISMGYDYESLSKKMKVFRVENSDFINVEFDAEDPYLAAFVANTMCREFMGYHAFITKENETKSIKYLGTLLEEKKDSELRRQEQIKRLKGLGEASTGPTDKASAAKASAPSGTYLGRLRARVRPNITFADSQLQAVKGNPEAEVEVTCSATGEILSKKLIRSSGNTAWDEAVMNAIEKTGTLPRDENGNMPPKISFGFRPRD